MSEIFSLRTTQELKDQIEHIAVLEKRSMNSLVNKVLMDFVNSYDSQPFLVVDMRSLSNSDKERLRNQLAEIMKVEDRNQLLDSK